MIFTALLAAFVGLTAAKTVSASCTTTIFPEGIACCAPIAGTTATSLIDCNNCALEIAPTPSCRAICDSPVPTDTASTTTITACGPSVTPTLTTLAERACTSTITKVGNPCGDCRIVYEATKTASMDCGGCEELVSVTSTKKDAVGICACPTGSVTTKEVCAASATPE